MANMLDSEIEILNYTINQADQSGNANDVAYLEGLTEKVHSGGILAPRNDVRKYGGAARLIDDNKDQIKGLMFGTEYNLLDSIRVLCAGYSDRASHEGIIACNCYQA